MEQCFSYGSECVGVAFEACLIYGYNNCYFKSLLGTPIQQSFIDDGAKSYIVKIYLKNRFKSINIQIIILTHQANLF